jgi:hypothetical protein
MQAKTEPTTMRILSDGHEGKKMTRRKTAPPPTEMGRLASAVKDEMSIVGTARAGRRRERRGDAQVNGRHDRIDAPLGENVGIVELDG